jgi:Tol biopolymer transport system component
MKVQTFAFLCVVLVIFNISTQLAEATFDAPTITWQRIEYPNNIYYDGLSFDPSGQMLAILDPELSRISLFNTLTTQPISNLPTSVLDGPNPFPSIQWSPNGEYFSLTVSDKLYVLDAETGSVQPHFRRFAEEYLVRGVRWSQDGESLAILTKTPGQDTIDIVSITNAETLEVIVMPLPSNGDYDRLPIFFDWSPDGNWFVRNVYGSNLGGLTGALWAIRRGSGVEQAMIASHLDETSCALGWASEGGRPYVRWSPDSSRLLYAGDSGLALCALESGILVETFSLQYIPREINARPVAIFPAIWSPDGRYIMATSSRSLDPDDTECRVRLYDPHNALQMLQIYDDVCIRHSMIWSSDGRYVAGVDREWIWLGTINNP